MKSRAKKLTDAICRDLPRLDKRYFKPGDYPGLELWVLPSGKKTWNFQYRTKNQTFTTHPHSQSKKRIFNFISKPSS